MRCDSCIKCCSSTRASTLRPTSDSWPPPCMLFPLVSTLRAHAVTLTQAARGANHPSCTTFTEAKLPNRLRALCSSIVQQCFDDEPEVFKRLRFAQHAHAHAHATTAHTHTHTHTHERKNPNCSVQSVEPAAARVHTAGHSRPGWRLGPHAPPSLLRAVRDHTRPGLSHVGFPWTHPEPYVHRPPPSRLDNRPY